VVGIFLGRGRMHAHDAQVIGSGVMGLSLPFSTVFPNRSLCDGIAARSAGV